MDDANDEIPALAKATGIESTLGRERSDNSIIPFPLHRTLRRRLWMPHRTRAWRRERFLRHDAITPLPFDFVEVRR